MKTLLFTLLVLSLFLPLHAADPVVSNVSAVQRAGTKLVDITFDVSDADSDQLGISVNVSDDAGLTFAVPSSALSGDVSVNATPTPTSKALVWDAGIDFNQQFSTEMVVRVIAADGSAPGPPPRGMKLIPAGIFLMGDDGSSEADEKPAHLVDVSAFYMDKFEVTKALWDEVKVYAEDNGYTIDNVGEAAGAHHPIGKITWYDAAKWCNARSEMEGLAPVYRPRLLLNGVPSSIRTTYRTGEKDLANEDVEWTANGYRLPTEAEWEKAARGGLGGLQYPWGNTLNVKDANYFDSDDPYDIGGVETCPVGFFDGSQPHVFGDDKIDRANGYGLYDMAGNVFEWCWDRGRSYSLAATPIIDPQGNDGTSITHRVVRGGSYSIGNLNNDPTDELRVAKRFTWFAPTTLQMIGFRCVRGL